MITCTKFSTVTSISRTAVHSLCKWVGEVSKNKDMTRRAFEKCGISVLIDGCKDEAIKIKGLDSYQVRTIDSDNADDDTDSD